jgi:hypothetical protein
MDSGFRRNDRQASWIPAFAGMTKREAFAEKTSEEQKGFRLPPERRPKNGIRPSPG